MKSSDAKNPKFDDAWWRTNKARDADKTKAFETALKTYATLRTATQRGAKDNKFASATEANKIVTALQQLKAEALKAAKDPKLGTAQKDTKDALAVYAKKADDAAKDLQQFANSPLMKMKTVDLMKHAPQFGSFSKISLTEENYQFLVACKDKKFGRQMYQVFVKQNAKYQINIDDALRSEFDDIEKKVADKELPDNAATWGAAPWKAAETEIVRLSDADTVGKFRSWMTGQQMARLMP